MPETETAWAAGFFDGEGSVHVAHSTPSRVSGKLLHYPQVSVSQSGEYGGEILHRFNEALLGVGKVYGPKPPGKNQRLERYLWEASGIDKTKAIYELLRPFLSTPKKDKFELVIKKYYEGRD